MAPKVVLAWFLLVWGQDPSGDMPDVMSAPKAFQTQAQCLEAAYGMVQRGAKAQLRATCVSGWKLLDEQLPEAMR